LLRNDKRLAGLEKNMQNNLFNIIAPVYGMFFGYQVGNFRTVIDKASTQIDIPEHSSFLDVGCGTGALPFVLSERGYQTTGVDAAPRMIQLAQNYNTGNKTSFAVGNVLNKLVFDSNSFDIVIASYVVHGMNEKDRKQLYAEARRLARKMIIFHDYNKKRSLGIDLIEWLEGGDYFNFIKIAEFELMEYFGNVQVIPVGKKSSWYIVEM